MPTALSNDMVELKEESKELGGGDAKDDVVEGETGCKLGLIPPVGVELMGIGNTAPTDQLKIIL